MRNSIHRAVLRRFVLRLSVLSALVLAFAALVVPGSWAADPVLLRISLGGAAFALVALPVAASLGKKPRARVTAPRAAMSEA